MIVMIDNNILVQMLTDVPLEQRISEYLQVNQAFLLIPTPVLAEFLAHDFNARRRQFLAMKNARCQIMHFDEKAAYICGELADKLHAHKLQAPRQKVKIDTQLLAIAQSNGVKIFLSDDGGIRNMVQLLDLSMQVLNATDLPTSPLFSQ